MMHDSLKSLTLFILLILLSMICLADQNLTTCLEGKYPSLCDRNKLTDRQRSLSDKAEKRQNLNLCLIGKYPSLCRKELLTGEELAKVNDAELRENFSICKAGKYPALCKHNLLTPTQAEIVIKSEKSENLKLCLVGKYKSLCRHDLLTLEEKNKVQVQENFQYKTQSTSKRVARRIQQDNCESGHWIDSIIDNGRIIKLEDQSIWEVDSIDKIYSMIWLPVSDIVVCGDRLINIDDNESVGVRRLR